MIQNKNIFVGLLLLLFFSGCTSTAVLISGDEQYFSTSIEELNSTHTQIDKSYQNGTVAESICIAISGSITEIEQEAC